MHRSHVGIQEWFWAAYLVATHTPGFSAKQLERQIGCAYRTAWFMLHRLRRAMVSDARSRLEGDVEADETIVGGPVKGKRGRGVTAVATKTLVFGAVEVISYVDKRGKAAERAGRIRLAIARKADEESIGQFLMQNVAEGSTISTDGWKGYSKTALANYGLLTDDRGYPVSISAFSGNTTDPKTLLPQVERLQGVFNLKSVIMIGDRGMISQKQVDELKGHSGMDWITALKTGAIRQLMDAEAIQLTLFDERNLFDFTHPDFPGEKLVACRNPELASRRKHKRNALLKATTEALEKIQGMITRGRLKEADKIGVRVGRVINQYKMAKHFKLEIEENQFHFEIDEVKVNAEAALDGIYVIRTSLVEDLSAEDAVRHYKALSQVERAFRSIKTMDLEVRPIHHYQEQRVRAHLFLCMLVTHST